MSGLQAQKRENRGFTLLSQTTIAAAVANQTSTPILYLAGMKYLAVQAVFNYGSGGTDLTLHVQTSLDEGTTWVDVMAFNFTTSAATKISAVHVNTALGAAITPTDGTLTDNTILNGLLGDRLRVKYTSTGTYAGATNIELTAVAKG